MYVCIIHKQLAVVVAIVSAVNVRYVRDVKMICEIGNLKLNFF